MENTMSTCRHCGHPAPANLTLPYVCPCGRSGHYEKGDTVTARKIALANAGGPAFPEVRKARPAPGEKARLQRVSGMSLRDYFATHAMQGLFAGGKVTGQTSDALVAKWAYAQADAMLAAREA